MNRSKPRIGIIGGAGPMAGALLFEKIIEICQKKYGCSRDSDFPYISLISYPFAEMLTAERNSQLIATHVEECFESFQSNDISIVAIACNTLHSFLPNLPKNLRLVHLIEETATYLREKEYMSPLVFCSNTSAEEKVHSRFFACRYPEQFVQMEVDALIDRILRGEDLNLISEQLSALAEDEMLVLGCTELSILHEKAPLKLKQICDPNLIVAEKICHLTFQ